MKYVLLAMYLFAGNVMAEVYLQSSISTFMKDKSNEFSNNFAVGLILGYKIDKLKIFVTHQYIIDSEEGKSWIGLNYDLSGKYDIKFGRTQDFNGDSISRFTFKYKIF